MKIENIKHIKNIKLQPAIENIEEIIEASTQKIIKPFMLSAELFFNDEMIHTDTGEEALRIQTALHIPADMACKHDAKNIAGLALIAHPHPLYGGTMDNKIVQTLIKTLNQLGYIAVRFNFRGVGTSNGSHDNGILETHDALRVFQYLQNDVPEVLAKLGIEINQNLWQNLDIVLGGFSFGTYVISHLQNHAEFPKNRLKKMIMIGTAAKKWDIQAVSHDSIVMHGDDDDVIPLIDVQEWAAKHQLNLQVVEKAGHYFHGKLGDIKNAILNDSSLITKIK